MKDVNKISALSDFMVIGDFFYEIITQPPAYLIGNKPVFFMIIRRNNAYFFENFFVHSYSSSEEQSDESRSSRPRSNYKLYSSEH